MSDKGSCLDMNRRHAYILVAGLAIAVLTACGNAETSASETPATYKMNATSMEDSEQQNDAGSEYEIDDMLPRPSDDTFIMSVEEAEAIMKNRADTDAETDTDMDKDADKGTNADPDTENSTKQKGDGSEYEIDDMLPRPSDDTLIMSVEEAEAFMKNRANTYSDVDKETSN